MGKYMQLIEGAVALTAGILTGNPMLIIAGAGLVISGIGTLLSQGPLQGTSTATRNPIAPWNVVYGRAKVPGVMIYFGEFGDDGLTGDDNDNWLDLVFVLACHACESVDALLFDGQRIQLSSGGGTFNGAVGDSFTPVQQNIDVFHISRTDNVVTVVLHSNIPLLQAGDNVIIQNISGDYTLNGTYPVAQILSRSGGITFTYLCGGNPAIVDAEGQCLTTWPDYGPKIHMECLLGNHTTTFPGMLYGTPQDNDGTTNVQYTNNPWTADHKCLGRTVVFLRLHYSDKYFAMGIPGISFLVSGKNNISDPRTSPATVGYSENAALCAADYLMDPTFGFRCLSTEVPVAQLIAAANVSDEQVDLAGSSPPATEARYTCNGTFPLTLKRGNVLENLLTACGGRITYGGGQFVIHPAAWLGGAIDLSGAGFGYTERGSAISPGRIDLTVFDSIANAAGRHAAEANWDATCNVLNYAVLVAFKPANELVAPECKQSFGIICPAPPYNPPDTFQTFEFVTGLTDEGSALIIDVAFQTQYPLSGLAIADDHGNVYKPVYGGHAAEGTYVCCFVCPSGSGGVLTITLTAATSIDGAYWFADLSVTFGEYAGLMDALPLGPWVPGDLFGGGYVDATGVCDAASAGAGPGANTIDLSVTTVVDNDLLHFITALFPDCGGGVVSVNVSAPVPMQTLAIAAGPFRWRSKVSIRDLYNGVKGTYISPANKWQTSDFPPYAQDTDHGYASGSPLYPFGDANLAADGGERRWFDIQLPFTISCPTAQRLAKIELMRRRQQGTGTFIYNMAIFQATALDVVVMTLPLLGWTNKLLEVSAHRLKFDKTSGKSGGAETTLLGTEIDVQETDPSVYAWSTTEELTPQGYQQATMPTNVGTLDDIWTVNGT